VRRSFAERALAAIQERLLRFPWPPNGRIVLRGSFGFLMQIARSRAGDRRRGFPWLGTAALVAVAAGLAPGAAPRVDLGALTSDRFYDVRILRDDFGVPHVFGVTDADAAFGLAWAHAEDDFATIQATVLATRGELASERGPDGAPNDYLVRLLRVWDHVAAGYPDLRPETRALCEAYAEGLNRYAAAHPREAIARLYPLRGEDLVAGFVYKLPLFFGLDRVLQGLLDPERRPDGRPPTGSNAFAVAPSRSADGHTRLVVNSHQPWSGPVAWYEAHLRSEEGWDAVGGLFPGAPVVLHGHNRHLGWAHTVNAPDLIDVYRLELDPDDRNRYRYDGGWLALEKRTASIEVKLLGPISWTFEREVLWSVHGPVIRGPEGTFALRVAGLGDVRAVEQWYQMNRAGSFGEWQEAMRTSAIPMFNTVYADRAGNIHYVYNARLPLRSERADVREPFPGDRPENLWTSFLPYDELPQVTNPPSGFVQSCNGSPFETTSGAGNPERDRFDPRFGIETYLTNRSRRALELLGGDDAISGEELLAYKFDIAYSPASRTARRARELARDAPRSHDPSSARAVELLGSWDLETGAGNRAAALALLTLKPDHRDRVDDAPIPELSARLADVARELEREFGRIDVPWGQVQRLRRGQVDLPLSGGPDTLRAIYTLPGRRGRREGVAGDSYVLLADWDREGSVRSWSVQPYGSSVGDARSPHYADQAPLFASQRLKPVWMDEREIRAHLEREYRPGEGLRGR